VAAYTARHYDGNLLDLVQNYAYPIEKLGDKGKEAYSYRRLVKYFVRPQVVNLMKFRKVMRFGQVASVLYPRRGPNPVQIDNRALDGFMDRFRNTGCQDLDCESCRYCHEWAERAVVIDPAWREEMLEIYADLLEEVDSGSFWDPYLKTLGDAARRLVG
jgi:hypothetical protein